MWQLGVVNDGWSTGTQGGQNCLLMAKWLKVMYIMCLLDQLGTLRQGQGVEEGQGVELYKLKRNMRV